jgi:hypothetical protein
LRVAKRTSIWQGNSPLFWHPFLYSICQYYDKVVSWHAVCIISYTHRNRGEGVVLCWRHRCQPLGNSDPVANTLCDACVCVYVPASVITTFRSCIHPFRQRSEAETADRVPSNKYVCARARILLEGVVFGPPWAALWAMTKRTSPIIQQTAAKLLHWLMGEISRDRQ